MATKRTGVAKVAKSPAVVRVTVDHDRATGDAWYSFVVGKTTYHLPHEKKAGKWTLMRDKFDRNGDHEYVEVASGAVKVRAWLKAHRVPGIPV